MGGRSAPLDVAGSIGFTAATVMVALSLGVAWRFGTLLCELLWDAAADWLYARLSRTERWKRWQQASPGRRP